MALPISGFERHVPIKDFASLGPAQRSGKRCCSAAKRSISTSIFMIISRLGERRERDNICSSGGSQRAHVNGHGFLDSRLPMLRDQSCNPALEIRVTC